LKQIIRNVRLRGREGSFDVALEDARVAVVEPSIDGDAEREYDGAGGLLVPGLVNAHQHLDKCMLGNVMRQNESQTPRSPLRSPGITSASTRPRRSSTVAIR
jgi:cytosine/creatinine deaminase